MKSLWDRFCVCIGAQAPDLLDVLKPGASKAAIRKAEVAMHIKFPADFVDFPSFHDGLPRVSSRFDNGMTLSSLDRTSQTGECDAVAGARRVPHREESARRSEQGRLVECKVDSLRRELVGGPHLPGSRPASARQGWSGHPLLARRCRAEL